MPDPKPYINLDEGNTGLVSLDKLAAQMLIAEMKDFDFDRNAVSIELFL